MSQDVAVAQCFVEIYPYEGGAFQITGGNSALLQATVTRSLKSPEGSFEIVLAPGGPIGVSAGPSWSEVITPMSLVLIGMRRGIYSQIVMIGVATAIKEDEAWNAGQGVRRVITVTGQDFGYFFATFNWVALTFLGGTYASILEPQLGNTPGAGLAMIIEGLASGTPKQVGAAWYNKVMAGTQGILAQSSFPFGTQRVPFTDAVATIFQEYPGFIIPFGDYFIATEGSWDAKFRAIFPFPFYEFFVITAPPNFYNPATGASDATSGYGFTMQALGQNVKASPTMVARINPLPTITASVISGLKLSVTDTTAPPSQMTSYPNSSVTYGAVDVSAWNNLPLFQPDFSTTTKSALFSIDEVRNFYLINPRWLGSLFGNNNGSIGNWIYTSTGAVDVASIHRYGYRPAYVETHWIADILGTYAQAGNIDLPGLISNMITRIFSYSEPTPLMLRAAASHELRPDIMPGCRYRYRPFKEPQIWDFYIESVTHQFVFGGASGTTIGLSRGLPSTIYADASKNGILTQAHLGNAQRIDGSYQVGVPAGLGAPLQPIDFTSNQSISEMQAQIAKVYVTPQSQ